MAKNTEKNTNKETLEEEVKQAESESTPIAGTEAKVKKMVKGMKAKLDAQPKVTIKIPVDKQNPKDLTCFVQINGYTFTIKRGEEVKVPAVVKKLLERAGTI